ncbi:MAG: hypothetical protein SVX43_16445 [Cyanobacteriota bacterium]|nr:hypothetical protein [Cyanobacteriota bacterium]
MRDWTRLKKRYLRDELPIRLGNLASNLARIKSFSRDFENGNTVEGVIQESKFFIEWTASEAEIETAAELVELQIQLSRWHYRWQTIWNDPEQRMKIAEQAKVWSDRVLEMSGLLSD